MTTTNQNNELSKAVTRVAYFASFAFTNGTLYVTTFNQNIVWNGQTWIGVGTLGAIDAVQETDTVSTSSVRFTLNSANSSLIAVALESTTYYRGQAVNLYMCPLDTTYALVDTPELCWNGIMDTMTVSIDEVGQSSIVLSCESTAYALKRRPTLRLNQAQWLKRHPTDTGLKYQTDLIANPQVWLSKKFQTQ